MSLGTTISRKDYTLTGGVYNFPFPYLFQYDSDLVVIYTDTSGNPTTLVLNTGYTVAGAGTISGSITVTTNYTSGTLTIKRVVGMTQDVVLNDQAKFSSTVIENEFDKLTMIDQQQQEQLDRAFIAPVSVTNLDLPTPTPGYMLGWNGTGTGLSNFVTGTGTGTALQADLASTASTALGDALIGVKSTLTGAIASTQHQVNEERVSVFRWFTPAQIADVVANTGSLDLTSAYALAVAGVAGTKKTLYFPNGTYKGSLITSGASQASLTIEGESLYGTILKPVDNATAVLNLGASSAFYPTVRNLTVTCGSVGNNGTHYGILVNATSGTRLEDIVVDGFNNNIHITANNNTWIDRVVSVGAVYAAGATGCNLYAANGVGIWISDSRFLSGKYGVYCDGIEAPTLVNCEALLNTNTGYYFQNYSGGVTYNTGPYLSNVFSDSSEAAGIYLQNQINSVFSSVWACALGGPAWVTSTAYTATTSVITINGLVYRCAISHTSGVFATDLAASKWTVLSACKGLVLTNSHFNTFQTMHYNCGGYAIHVAGGSHHNTFTGTANSNWSDGVVVEDGCYSNIFNGMVVQGNGGKGFNCLNTSGEPNIIDGCYIAGNTGGNVFQTNDTKSGGNLLFGQTTALAFGKNGVAASGAGAMLAGGLSGTTYVMPRSGAIVGFSLSLSATVTSGTLSARPQIASGVKDTLRVQLTSGGTPQYGYANLLNKSIPFAAGAWIGVYWDGDSGLLPTGTGNAVATVWVVLD